MGSNSVEPLQFLIRIHYIFFYICEYQGQLMHTSTNLTEQPAYNIWVSGKHIWN